MSMLGGLTACVTEVHEYRTRVTTTTVHTDDTNPDAGFFSALWRARCRENKQSRSLTSLKTTAASNRIRR